MYNLKFNPPSEDYCLAAVLGSIEEMEGVTIGRISEKLGFDVVRVTTLTGRLSNCGMIEVENGNLRLSRKGMDVLGVKPKRRRWI